MRWSTPFYEPIPLPGGGQIVSFNDAAYFIQRLPKAEQDLHEWRFAIEMLINTAENGWPPMMAHIAILRALGHRKMLVKEPRRKEPNWGKRKLKRCVSKEDQ